MPFRFAAVGPGRWGGWGERRHLGSRQRVGVVYSMWEGGCTRVLGGRGRHSPSSAIVTAQERQSEDAKSGSEKLREQQNHQSHRCAWHAPESG